MNCDSDSQEVLDLVAGLFRLPPRGTRMCLPARARLVESVGVPLPLFNPIGTLDAHADCGLGLGCDETPTPDFCAGRIVSGTATDGADSIVVAFVTLGGFDVGLPWTLGT